jgi:hypothetical protein
MDGILEENPNNPRDAFATADCPVEPFEVASVFPSLTSKVIFDAADVEPLKSADPLAVMASLGFVAALKSRDAT